MAFLNSGTSFEEVAGGVGSHPTSFAANVTAGSLLVLWISWDATSGQTVTGVADNHSATWTKATAASMHDATNNQSGSLYYLENAASGATTVTATFSANTTFIRVVVGEWDGVATTAALDQATVANATNTTATDNISSGATATLAQASELVISGALDDANNATFTGGTGYTRRVISAATSGFDAALEDKTVSATTAVTGTWTGSVASRYICCVATFKLTTAAAQATPSPIVAPSTAVHRSHNW